MKINFGKPRDRIQKDEKEEEKKERGMGNRRGEEGEGTKHPRTQRLKRGIMGSYLGQSC